jgi:polyphenol oxidase
MISPPALRYDRMDGIRMLADPGARDAGLLVAFTDRGGGVSAPPYDTLNLALRSDDDAGAVVENRRRAARAIGFSLDRLALGRQVHATDVLEVDPHRSGVVGEADVLIARERGPVVGILAADCGAVAIAGDDGVAIVHAGWRGLAAGVVDAAVAALGAARAAWVGPCIRACCYEVGPEVVAAFEAAGLPVAGPGRVDIGAATVHALERAGVERFVDSGVCTHCGPSYFSYRRDGVTGRQGAFVARLPV